MLKTTEAGRPKGKAEHVHGGAGYITKDELITPEQRGEHCRLFNAIRLLPGAEIGYHEHHGETETYYILEGTATYEEDGQTIQVEAGDVTFCDDGHGHGIANTGDAELVFVAMILAK